MKELYKARIAGVTEVITVFVVADSKQSAFNKIKNKYPFNVMRNLTESDFYEVEEGYDYTSESLIPDH